MCGFEAVFVCGGERLVDESALSADDLFALFAVHDVAACAVWAFLDVFYVHGFWGHGRHI